MYIYKKRVNTDNLHNQYSGISNSSKKNILIKAVYALIITLSIFLLISTSNFAIPNSLTLQGKLTNLAGASQQGTYNFTFRIYDTATSGNILWEKPNFNLTTDANGVYDVVLSGINLSFADQYYLGITVSTDAESVPRINLTSSPYSFRANTSESLNPNASYFVTNLSVTGNAIIGDGTTKLDISTQVFNFSSTTGNLNINGTITAKSFVGDGSLLSGIIPSTNPWNSSGTNVFFNDTNANLGLGLINPSDRLVIIGNVRISGSLNASSINTTGSAYFATNSGKVGIGTTNPADILTVIGSVSVFGPLNATFINATQIFMGGTYLGNSFSNFQISNVSNTTKVANILDNNLLTLVADAFNKNNMTTTNITINNLTITGNLPLGWTNLTGVPSFSNFQLSNVSNNTIVRGDNASISLWNVSGSNVYPRFLSGNVGIGTTTPGQTLHVVGSANISTTLNAPVINTTRADQNITISSAAGSVIIRLG